MLRVWGQVNGIHGVRVLVLAHDAPLAVMVHNGCLAGVEVEDRPIQHPRAVGYVTLPPPGMDTRTELLY